MDEIESCFATRIYNNRNKQAFSQAISEIDWLETCRASDIQKAFDLFHNKLILLHNNCTSVKNETVYKKYRNKFNNILKVTEKKHYHDLIKSHKGDTKKSWAIIKIFYQQT